MFLALESHVGIPMQIHLIRDDSGRTLARIHDFTDKPASAKALAAATPYSQRCGYAGFRERESLEAHLKYFSGESNAKHKIVVKELLVEITPALNACFSVVRAKAMDIFVFPSANSFVKEKMSGVGGYCFWKNLIHIYLNPAKGWQSALRKAIAHEFAHAFSLNYLTRRTLLDDFVQEGVAQHFQEKVIGEGPEPWAVSLDRGQSLGLFAELKPMLGSKNLFQEVFFGTGKYPGWAGYAIGYNIVADYLKGLPEISWPIILKSSSRTIIRKSGWLFLT